DSIAQGRVWIGETALKLHLVDRLGSLQDAINCAARLAHVKEYTLKEYPEAKSFLELLLGNYKKTATVKAMKEQLGEEGYKTFTSVKRIRSYIGTTQSRLPFDFDIE